MSSVDEVASPDRNGDSGTPNSSGSSSTTALAWRSPGVILGFAILVGFAVLIQFMVIHRADKQWDHLTYLHGSLQAIVTIALGAIYGTGVQRQQTAKADQRANDAGQEVRDLRKQSLHHISSAAKGHALADVIRGEVKALPTSARTKSIANFASPRSAEDAHTALLIRLAAIANEMFPSERESS
jgi:hypothetical protein